MRAALGAALAAWAADPRLAGPLGDSAAAYLVLDGTGTALRYASDAAGPLGRAIADGDGVVESGVAAQLRAGIGDGRPRLVRLRLDRSRIAPPAACLIAGGALDGAPALLVLVTGPLPAFRPRRVTVPRPAVDAPAVPEPEPAAIPAAGDRFVWCSDAADRIATVSGPSAAALAPILVGESWASLAQSGRLSGADAILSAVRERRTFRAEPATLALAAAGTLALDVSGARLGRGGDAYAGFGGYGVVRAAPPALPAPAMTDPPPTDVEATTASAASIPVPEPVPPAPGGAPPARLPDIRTDAWPPVTVAAARFGGARIGSDATARPPEPARSETAVVPANAAIPAQTVPPEPASETGERPDAALSVTEHAAFREIARALGARYAGDDAAGDALDRVAGPMRGESGAVMPFPTAKAVDTDPPVPAAGDAVRLDDLPMALLVYRGDAVLAANRPFLDLSGHADLASLRTEGLQKLFGGSAPEFADAGSSQRAAPLLIETRRGSRPVAVAQGPTVWEGAQATCLILRPVDEADPAAAAVAERLARTFRDRHEADAHATLDALDDGVVTLDAASRIVAMNRAAAGVFACEPREVVGTDFEALFEAPQRDAVRASVAGLGPQMQAVTVDGRPLMLRAARRDGTRVAVLHAVFEQPALTTGEFDRSAFLGRLDREIRPPVENLVGLADGLLSEPHGSIDERDRAALRTIKAAGDHVRGLVGDLFDLATIESGGRALAVRPLPLNDLVSACVDLLQAEATRGRIVLRTSFAPDLAPTEADEPSMRQAALAVIGNAIRATGAGGQVIVSTTPGESGGVALKVRGTGPGMSPEEIERAFEPLGTGAHRGGGLGLPLTKALVEANRGHLRISSRKDEGTLVEILLPGPLSRSA